MKLFSYFQNSESLRKHNFNQKFRLPESYDKNVFPEDIVEVQVGFYYSLLQFLDLPSTKFGVKHTLHLAWSDSRLAWNSSKPEVSILRSNQIWTPSLSFSATSVDSDFDFTGTGPEVRVFRKVWRFL